ncbi:glycosyltransferase [Flaviaesturariibacter aridisoli]|uniref:Glycosyltransferase n=1 Tax=Flaviaesturariibacter aridisoli TaxID=2545761 RepID=A0A4R4E5R5_9BACT|nr:glycosyltransferase [Flaviaesturariibacter aridisoli]TCZ72995.1 glycosyltransferase [Flaviaesturariibacter aridisoli]
MNPQALLSLQPGTKVLFACVPFDGHFSPLTGLARYLSEKGCDVRWYTSADYREKVERLGLRFYCLRKAKDVHADDIDTLFPERARLKSQVKKLVFDLVHCFILRAPEYFEDLQAIRKEFPFDALVCDVAFGAIPFVTDLMRVPVFAMGIVPLTESSRDLPPAGLGMTPSASFAGRRRQDLLRFVANRILFARPDKVMRRLLRAHGIEPVGRNVFDLNTKKATRLLQSGTPGFEFRRSDLGRNIRFVGALLPWRKPSGTQAWFDERLNRYEKVVLLTQGTVEKDITKLLVPALEAFRDSDCLVLCTTGGSDTAALRERFPEPHMIIEDFIPFSDVLPYTDVYVTNGGYGGVLLALEHGVPMVTAGVHEGKNEICARVGYFELGINLRTELPGPVQVREAVDQVLGSSVYAHNARRMAAEIAHYPSNELCAHYMAELLGAAPLSLAEGASALHQI